MKMAVLSDIHGSIEYLEDIAADLKKVDCVVICGDITNFGGRAQAQKVLAAITTHNATILAVTGNCDMPAVEKYLDETEMNLSGRSYEMNSYSFIGAGGSLPCPGVTPNESGEDIFSKTLKDGFLSALNQNKMVMVTHQPPFDTRLDDVGDGRHTGSVAMRRFIEERQPVLALSGHIHEAFGVDRVESTVLINPGPFRRGQYAIVELLGDRVDYEFKTARK